MRSSKQLDKELNIKHIKKPFDLEPLVEDMSLFIEPEYPYKSKWVETQPEPKRVAKKPLEKDIKENKIIKDFDWFLIYLLYLYIVIRIINHFLK